MRTSLLLVFLLALNACGDDNAIAAPPATSAPTTGIPATGAPTTGIPATSAPTTGVPADPALVEQATAEIKLHWAEFGKKNDLSFLMGLSQAAPDGGTSRKPIPLESKPLDPWGHPYAIEFAKQAGGGRGGQAAAVSAGPDREFGTSDDIRWPITAATAGK